MFGHGRRLHESRYEQAGFDAALRDELVAAVRDELSLEATLRASGALAPTQAPIDHPDFARLSEQHAARIWDLIDDLELWPGNRICGPEGATAAWRIVMHAQRDLDLQRRAVEHLEIAVDFGDAEPLHLVTLEDRIAMAEGRPQRYGTQFVPTADGTHLEAWPIDEPEGVDGRRARVGLGPVAADLAAANARFHGR
jgi:hypothetical protein